MILITHKNLDSIRDNYTAVITAEVMSRVQIILNLIPLLQYPTPITAVQIGNSFSEYKGALAPLLNVKKLTSATKVDLIANINANRNSANPRFLIVKTALNKSGLITRVETLISAETEKLKGKQTQMTRYLGLSKSDMIFKYLFSYDDFYSDFITPIGKELDIKVCPYCNRSYITHINGKGKNRVIGPTFDHFFHQAENPLLALSFYNLIPSCALCNSNLKGQKKFELHTHLHPYLHELEANGHFDFDLRLIGKSREVAYCPKIVITASKGSSNYKRLVGFKKSKIYKDSGSLNVFKLNEIYASHFDVVEEVHLKFDKNSPHYIKSIADQLKMMKKSEEEFYRFHFGNYYDKEDFHRRPLAKLTKDIYNKLKSISPVH